MTHLQHSTVLQLPEEQRRALEQSHMCFQGRLPCGGLEVVRVDEARSVLCESRLGVVEGEAVVDVLSKLGQRQDVVGESLRQADTDSQ